jgi:flagellar biosynthesis chaperone FliJ
MKIKILQLVKSKENRKLQDLNLQLSNLQKVIDKDQKHMHLLKGYSKEYRNTLSKKMEEGLSKEFLEYYYSFIRYLDKVVKDQELNIQGLLAQKKFLIALWQNQFLKHKSLEQMLISKELEERKILDRKIEKSQEDIVASRIQKVGKD